MTDKCNYSLLAHNTFGMDVCCHRFMEYETVDEAKEVARRLSDIRAPHLIIGAGSNLLLTTDYDGVVVHSAIKGISIVENGQEATLCCGSGTTWDEVVGWTVSMGYADLVNLSMIPGEVGAAAVQNIGAYGAEVSQTLTGVQAVEVNTGQVVNIGAEDCRYGYRSSRFKQDWKGRYLITHVCFRLNRNAPFILDYGNVRSELERQGLLQPTAAQVRQTIIDIRRQKLPDPKALGNAGSFFMNPVVERGQYDQLVSTYGSMPHYEVDDRHVKIPAGWLIEQCGWKGRSLGRAGVFERQALVLVNRGGATGSDIVALCQAIQTDVQQRFGIVLQPEVNIV